MALFEENESQVGMPVGCSAWTGAGSGWRRALCCPRSNVFIDDVVPCVEATGALILLCADDIAIAAPTAKALQAALERVEEHAADNHYRLNPSKCKVIGAEGMQLAGETLEAVASFTYLGVEVGRRGVLAVKHARSSMRFFGRMCLGRRGLNGELAGQAVKGLWCLSMGSSSSRTAGRRLPSWKPRRTRSWGERSAASEGRSWRRCGASPLPSVLGT